MEIYGYQFIREEDLMHYGLKGMHWGTRRWQNYDATNSFNEAGIKRYFGYTPGRDSVAKELGTKTIKKKDLGQVHKEHHEKVMQIKESSMSKAEKEAALKEEQMLYDKKVKNIHLSNKQKEKIKKALIITGVVGITAAVAVVAVKKSGITIDDIKHTVDGTDKWLLTPEHIGKHSLYTDASLGASFANEKLWSTPFWKNSLTAAERNAIQEYTGSSYKLMNKILRSGSFAGLDPKKANWYSNLINDATSALSKASLPEDVMVHRGVGSLNSLAKTLGIDVSALKNPAQAKALIGQSFVDNAFGSTGMSTADAWAGAKLHIKLPKGSQAMWVDPISAVHGEHEVIINRGARYVISDIRFGLNGQVEDVLVELIEHVI